MAERCFRKRDRICSEGLLSIHEEAAQLFSELARSGRASRPGKWRYHYASATPLCSESDERICNAVIKLFHAISDR